MILMLMKYIYLKFKRFDKENVFEEMANWKKK